MISSISSCSHLGCSIETKITNCVEDHLGYFPPMFLLNWFSGFRKEDKNVKRQQMQIDDKNKSEMVLDTSHINL